jgi:hypothetical protein
MKNVSIIDFEQSVHPSSRTACATTPTARAVDTGIEDADGPAVARAPRPIDPAQAALGPRTSPLTHCKGRFSGLK